MGGQYGSYIMYFLSQLLEKQRQMEKRKQMVHTLRMYMEPMYMEFLIKKRLSEQ